MRRNKRANWEILKGFDLCNPLSLTCAIGIHLVFPSHPSFVVFQTRILQPSIGGNARTSIIVTVSPSACNVEHTVSSLRFGARAITIKNHAHVNEIHADQAFINQHQQQIEAHERHGRLSHDGSIDEHFDTEREASRRQQEEILTEQMRLKEDLEEQLANLQQLILKSTTSAMHTSERGAKQRRRHSLGSQPFVAAAAASATSRRSLEHTMRDQQLATQSARIAQLESLLSELSTENGELLERENRHTEEAEEMAQMQEMMSNHLELYSLGKGVEKLSLQELKDTETRMQLALKNVQRQMYFAEFQIAYPKGVTTNTKTPTTEETDESDEKENVVDQQTLQMQTQIAELQKQLEEVNNKQQLDRETDRIIIGVDCFLVETRPQLVFARFVCCFSSFSLRCFSFQSNLATSQLRDDFIALKTASTASIECQQAELNDLKRERDEAQQQLAHAQKELEQVR